MTFVVATIEPEPSAFIGACLLYRSLLQNSTGLVSFRLSIIRRGSHESELASLAAALGISVRLAASDHRNGFLNKWPGLAAHRDLRGAAHVVCLDWDALLLRRASLPGPFGSRIGARQNPTDLYARRLGALSQPIAGPPLVGRDFHVPSSINGGVLIGAEDQLRQCGEITIRYEGHLSGSGPNWELWEREQLALSLAVGELGLHPIDPRWNTTRRSNVPPAAIVLWHYSDGWPPTLRLKRCLHRPEYATALLREIQMELPEPASIFLRFYSQILDEPWFGQVAELGMARARS